MNCSKKVKFVAFQQASFTRNYFLLDRNLNIIFFVAFHTKLFPLVNAFFCESFTSEFVYILSIYNQRDILTYSLKDLDHFLWHLLAWFIYE